MARSELVVAEGARVSHLVRLLLEGGDDLRVTVTLVHRRVGGEEVHVALPLGVPDPAALGALDDDRQRMVVVRPGAVFEGAALLGAGGGLLQVAHDRIS